MRISVELTKLIPSFPTKERPIVKAIANAFEVIPRTIAQNCGADVVRIITDLRSKHFEGQKFLGIEGNSGKIEDMNKKLVWDPLNVKLRTYKNAIESSCMLLWIDDIVSGIKKKEEQRGGPQMENPEMETFGDQRDG